jgi:hypothetical protein
MRKLLKNAQIAQTAQTAQTAKNCGNCENCANCQKLRKQHAPRAIVTYAGASTVLDFPAMARGSARSFACGRGCEAVSHGKP